MVTKRYDLLFQGIDRVSNVVGLIDGRIGTLTRNVGQAGQAFGGAGNLGAGSMLLYGGAIAAVSTALLAATSIASGFTNQLKSGIDSQLSQVSSAIDGATILGVSIDRTDQIIQKMTQTIAENAAKLPGATSVYTALARNIYDEVIPAARGLNGVLDEQMLIKKTEAVSRLFGLMGSRVGASMNDITSAATKALSGALTLGEMNQLELFAQNPLFKKRIGQELKLRGVEQLKELNEVQRVELFNKLSLELVSPQAITKLSGTFSGKLEGLLSQIFDPDIGILGFNNPLKGRGNRKVIDAATSVLGEIEDIFDVLEVIFSNAGLTDDSVGEFIYDRIQDFANFLNNIQRYLSDNEAYYVQITRFTLWIGDILGKIFNASWSLVEVYAYFYDKLIKIAVVVGILSEDLVKKFGQGIEYLGKKFNQATSFIVSAVTPAIDFVTSAIDKAIGATMRLFSLVSSVIQGRVGDAIGIITGSSNDAGVSSSKQSSSGGIIGTVTNALSLNPLTSVSNFIGNALSSGVSALSNVVGANYDGFIPNNILNLSQTESSFNPSGGKQFITSENEYVFTPEQMANLINNVQASAQKNFYITVQTVSEQQFADMIVRSINQQWLEANSAS